MRLVFQPVELITGFEPVTSSLPRKCSTYWAIWACRHNLLAPPFLFGAGSENRTRVISLEGWGSTTKLYPLKQSVPWSIYSSVILVLNAHSAKLWLWCSWLITKLQLLYIKSTSIHIDINSYRHQFISTSNHIDIKPHQRVTTSVRHIITSVAAPYLLPPVLCLFFQPHGGGGWIRTTEAFASDLQSDPFDRSGTPPILRR